MHSDAQQTRHNESVLRKVRRIVIQHGGRHSQRNKTQFFLSAPKRTQSKCRENGADTWRDISHWLLETIGHMLSRAEPIEEKEKEDHARLPAQVPASRVPSNPGGNNRQERKDAVSGLKDGNHRADNAWARQQDRA